MLFPWLMNAIFRFLNTPMSLVQLSNDCTNACHEQSNLLSSTCFALTTNHNAVNKYSKWKRLTTSVFLCRRLVRTRSKSWEPPLPRRRDIDGHLKFHTEICHAFFTLKSMMGKIYKCQTLQHGKMERQTILPAGASFPSHSYPRISITWNPTQSLGVFE